MKKLAALLFILVTAISLAACAGNEMADETNIPDTQSGTSAESAVPENSEAASESGSEPVQPKDTEIPIDPDNKTAGSHILVAYFSATGTTEGVAGHIADGLNADLYEIVPEEPYTDADLDYHDNNSRSTAEMNDPSSRPAISGSVENMDQYDIVFLGYPIWWGEAPRIVSSFVESYDFSGKTIVPFCTSGGSGIGSSATNLEALTSGAAWLEGQRLNGGDSRDTVMEWVNGLGLSK